MLGAILIILLLGSLIMTNLFAFSPLSLLAALAPHNPNSLVVVLLVLLACFRE